MHNTDLEVHQPCHSFRSFWGEQTIDLLLTDRHNLVRETSMKKWRKGLEVNTLQYNALEKDILIKSMAWNNSVSFIFLECRRPFASINLTSLLHKLEDLSCYLETIKQTFLINRTHNHAKHWISYFLQSHQCSRSKNRQPLLVQYSLHVKDLFLRHKFFIYETVLRLTLIFRGQTLNFYCLIPTNLTENFEKHYLGLGDACSVLVVNIGLVVVSNFRFGRSLFQLCIYINKIGFCFLKNYDSCFMFLYKLNKNCVMIS